jgi:hypothetical protein
MKKENNSVNLTLAQLDRFQSMRGLCFSKSCDISDKKALELSVKLYSSLKQVMDELNYNDSVLPLDFVHYVESLALARLNPKVLPRENLSYFCSQANSNCDKCLLVSKYSETKLTCNEANSHWQVLRKTGNIIPMLEEAKTILKNYNKETAQ